MAFRMRWKEKVRYQSYISKCVQGLLKASIYIFFNLKLMIDLWYFKFSGYYQLNIMAEK